MINPYHLKKDELLLLLTGRCKHNHTYLEHPNCFRNEVLYNTREFIRGFFDIESSNLTANFGIMLSYAIKVDGKNKIYYGIIKKDDLINGTLDKNLVAQCIEDLNRFHEIVTYNGSRFDIPFIRSRYLYWKSLDPDWDVEFPMYGFIKHKDVYYMVKNRLRLHRNRLDDACRFLGIKGKTHVSFEHWIRALTGDEKALKYILHHNKQDVRVLEKLYHKLENYVRRTNRSI